MLRASLDHPKFVLKNLICYSKIETVLLLVLGFVVCLRFARLQRTSMTISCIFTIYVKEMLKVETQRSTNSQEEKVESAACVTSE